MAKRTPKSISNRNDNFEANSELPKSINTNEEKIKIARFRMWTAITVAFITTCGGGLFGYLGFKSNTKDAKASSVSVPIQITNSVSTLPVATSTDDYTLLKDISIFDLRQWKQTPPDKKNERFSPADYTNYLHIILTHHLDSIVIHYATTGFAIDMRCVTHDFTFFKRSKPIFHDGAKYKEYALSINTSNIESNKEFLVVVEATYWNGFANLNEEDASTYTDEEIHGLNELGLIVFFPDGKPFKSHDQIDKNNSTKKEVEYRGDNDFYEDKNKKFIYWSIKQHAANHHYTLKWTW